MSMNGKLRTIAMGADLQRRVLKPTNTMMDAFRSMKTIEDALMPPSVRMWRDMQRGLESHEDPNCLHDTFDELSGPIVGVRRPSIPGGHQGSGRPTGKLTPVPLTDDDEDGA